MMGMWLRFPAGATPPEELVRERLTALLGPWLARGVEELRIEGTRMTLLSMDIIVIMYAWRVGELLGGTRELGGARVSAPALASWARRPWTSYGLLERLRIRLGRIRF